MAITCERPTDERNEPKAAATMETPVVFVIDEDVSVRKSLEVLIGSMGWRVEVFASAREFRARPRSGGACCLVLDVSLGLGALEVQTHTGIQRTHMPVICISGHADIAVAVRAMKAGAVEFLTKPIGDRQLGSAIRDALRRSRAALEHDAELGALRDAYASLSRREREVMARVVTGRLNKHIASDLGISEITVKAHRGRVMRKMKADSLVDLVNMESRLHATGSASA